MTERELWASKAATKLQNPVVHAQRYSFNFGFQMGVEVAKEIAIEKFEWLILEMKKRRGVNFSAELKLLESLLEYHRTLGEQEIPDGTSEDGN